MAFSLLLFGSLRRFKRVTQPYWTRQSVRNTFRQSSPLPGRGQSISAPQVLVADLSRSFTPFAFTLSECLPGLTLSRAYEDMRAAGRFTF